MASNSRLRPVDSLMVGAVVETLDALGLPASDTAVARLARSYAELLDEDDDPKTWAVIGARLLNCLAELGATPRSRAGMKLVDAPGGRGRLAALRETRVPAS